LSTVEHVPIAPHEQDSMASCRPIVRLPKARFDHMTEFTGCRLRTAKSARNLADRQSGFVYEPGGHLHFSIGTDLCHLRCVRAGSESTRSNTHWPRAAVPVALPAGGVRTPPARSQVDSAAHWRVRWHRSVSAICGQIISFVSYRCGVRLRLSTQECIDAGACERGEPNGLLFSKTLT
jgi:hypothetical protein